MNKDEIEKRKFEMLVQAYLGAQRQDEAMNELRDAAFEVLLLHPGCDLTRWKQILCKQYGTEMVDAYGHIDEPYDMVRELEKLWTSRYRDDNSGLERTYETWAEVFANKESVQMYYDLIKDKKKT